MPNQLEKHNYNPNFLILNKLEASMPRWVAGEPGIYARNKLLHIKSIEIVDFVIIVIIYEIKLLEYRNI